MRQYLADGLRDLGVKFEELLALPADALDLFARWWTIQLRACMASPSRAGKLHSCMMQRCSGAKHSLPAAVCSLRAATGTGSTDLSNLAAAHPHVTAALRPTTFPAATKIRSLCCLPLPSVSVVTCSSRRKPISTSACTHVRYLCERCLSTAFECIHVIMALAMTRPCTYMQVCQLSVEALR